MASPQSCVPMASLAVLLCMLLCRLLLHWVCGMMSQLRYSNVRLLSKASLTFMDMCYLVLPCRLLLHWVCGVVSQLRYSFVWLLSEASLTFMGLNLKGWDEKERPIW